MRVLFCKIGWMINYAGNVDKDPIKNGGSYNLKNNGYEIYNFKNFAGKYYGFIEPEGTIHIERIDKETKEDYLENVLVIWIATKPKTGGQYIVGWYKNAKVYRKMQELPNIESLKSRIAEGFNIYNIESNNAFLLSEANRTKKIIGAGQHPLWYGNPEIKDEVVKYITEQEESQQQVIENITSEKLIGKEKEMLIKARVNQGKFRELVKEKFKNKCALCEINMNELLIASHIKPWSVSTDTEKLNENNGLLLCSIHDKLFDSGLISFDEEGNILISSKLDKTNQIYSNIRENMKIDIDEHNSIFLKYHRDNIFQK